MWSYMTGGQASPASESGSTTTAAASTDALLATANDNTRLGLAYGMGGTISGGKALLRLLDHEREEIRRAAGYVASDLLTSPLPFFLLSKFKNGFSSSIRADCCCVGVQVWADGHTGRRAAAIAPRHAGVSVCTGSCCRAPRSGGGGDPTPGSRARHSRIAARTDSGT